MTEIQELKSELQTIKNLLAAALGGLIPKQREVNTYDYLDEWLETCKKPFVCEKTYKDLFRNVNAHIKPNLPDKRLYEITADDLQKCLNAIPQARTRESVHTVLLNAFTRAHNLGYIPKNPGEGMIYRKHRRKGRQPLSVAQQREFREQIEACRPVFRNLFLFYLLTGTRKCEPLLSTWSDVKREENTLMLHGTKTETSETRPIPIYRELGELLDKMERERTERERLFPVSMTAIQKEVVKLKRRLSFPFSLHMLRHTFITNCVEDGVNIKAVQRWAGHKSLETTEKIYTHISREFEQSEALKITG